MEISRPRFSPCSCSMRGGGLNSSGLGLLPAHCACQDGNRPGSINFLRSLMNIILKIEVFSEDRIATNLKGQSSPRIVTSRRGEFL